MSQGDSREGVEASMRSSILVFLAASLCACSRVPTKLPDAGGPGNCLQASVLRSLSLERHRRVKEPERSCVLDERAIAYASLPVLQKTTAIPSKDGLESFTTVYRPRVETRLPLQARALLPPQPRETEWLAFAEAGKNAEKLNLFYFSGSSEVGGVVGDAKAIVPSTLYAFRECVSGCELELGAPEREERVVLVGPYAEWTSSSTDDVEFDHSRIDASFAFASAPLKPGSSASVGLTVTPHAMSMFGGKLDPRFHQEGNPDLYYASQTFTLDIVWPLGSDPDSILYTGEIVEPVRAAFHDDVE
jgi:hypothetical protein